MQHLPLFIGEAGPTSVSGSGNYVRSIRSPADSQDDRALFTMYFLDTHANVKKVNPWADPEYDYIKADQINWFRGRSSQIHSYTRPYRSDSRAVRSPLRVGSRREQGRLSRRQDGDGSWQEAAVAELQKLEKEFGLDGSISPAVEPDDGSNIIQEPSQSQDDVEQDGSSDEAISDSDETSSAPATTSDFTDEEEELLEGADDREPTVLPAGPTRAQPMEAKPNAILWQHIPLPEAYSADIDVSPSGKRLLVGARYEGNGAPKYNSGFWEQGILAQKELPGSTDGVPIDSFWDGEGTSPTEGRPEVKVVANGHCHISSDCRRLSGVWSCFGGGATVSPTFVLYALQCYLLTLHSCPAVLRVRLDGILAQDASL